MKDKVTLTKTQFAIIILLLIGSALVSIFLLLSNVHERNTRVITCKLHNLYIPSGNESQMIECPPPRCEYFHTMTPQQRDNCNWLNKYDEYFENVNK